MKSIYLTFLTTLFITGCAYNTPAIDSDKDGVIDLYDKCQNTPLLDKVNAQGCSLK